MARAKKRSSSTDGFVDSLNEHVSDLYETATEEGKRTLEAIAEQIAERPLACLLLAFGTGFVADRIFRRPR
jgi:hypothetical protein